MNWLPALPSRTHDDYTLILWREVWKLEFELIEEFLLQHALIPVWKFESHSTQIALSATDDTLQNSVNWMFEDV